jgi:uncharacterized protein
MTDHHWISRIEDLETLYSAPSAASLRKVTRGFTAEYRQWVEQSRFCVLSTVGPEGTDASPRGDDGPVVRFVDAQTLALPDWQGNERIDSLRNIIADPRLSLMFFVPGSANVLRLNGEGRITADFALRRSFARGARLPRSVLVIRAQEVYFQCARAILRSGLWSGQTAPTDLPSAGQMLAGASAGDLGGEAYDRSWPERAAETLW